MSAAYARPIRRIPTAPAIGTGNRGPIPSYGVNPRTPAGATERGPVGLLPARTRQLTR